MDTKTFEQPGINAVRLALSSLSVYRHLLEEKVITELLSLLDYISSDKFELCKATSLYNQFFFSLANSNAPMWQLNSLKDLIIDRIIFDENPFTRRAEAQDFCCMDKALKAATSNDLRCLNTVSRLSSSTVKAHIAKYCSPPESDVTVSLPSWEFQESLSFCGDEAIIKEVFYSGKDWSVCVEVLSNFHRKCGCGIFARYKGFIWERTGNHGQLKGISAHDPIALCDLIGYDVERSEVINNTLQFLRGFAANNVLLYGDRGTGKSSTVKAILNEYHSQGLRIVEVPKMRLIDFPAIIRELKGRAQKFIIFVDDLAFEDKEENYTALKAVLEGGLESKPHNVLIYATSNRRHLIKEKFSDRLGLQSSDPNDEIRAADSMQEKLSLADRFGITVVFSSPDKYKYLEIVEGIAAKRGLEMDKEMLHKEALKWELWYNGRSPRTARQFVDWLEGQIKK